MVARLISFGAPAAPLQIEPTLGSPQRAEPVPEVPSASAPTSPGLRAPGRVSAATLIGDRNLQSGLLQRNLLAQVHTPAEQRELRDRVLGDDAKVRESLKSTLTTLDQSLGTVPGYTDRLRARFAATTDGTTSGVAAEVSVVSGRVAAGASVTNTKGPEGSVTTAAASVTVGLGPSAAELESAQKQRAAESTALQSLGTSVSAFMDAVDKVSNSSASPEEKARLAHQQLLPRLEILGTIAASNAYGQSPDGKVSPRFQALMTSLIDVPMSVLRDLSTGGNGATERLDAGALVRSVTAPVTP